jgi:hypothetical protein
MTKRSIIASKLGLSGDSVSVRLAGSHNRGENAAEGLFWARMM